MPRKSASEMKELVGWKSPAFSVTLEKGRVADFAEAVLDDDSVFTDPVEARARGLSAPPVPITFFGSVFFIDEDVHEPDLGFDKKQALHGGQEFTFNRTPLVGETLYGRTELTGVYEKASRNGNTIVIAEYETGYRDEEGELVLTSTRTRLEVDES